MPATSAGRRRSFWREGILLERSLQIALRDLLAERARFDEPMSRHTSLQVGGPADAFVRPASVEELDRIAALCRTHGTPWRVVGSGFNTLVRDGGLREVAISLGLLRELRRVGDAVFAQAGVTHTALGRLCVAQGLAGMEFAIGIPGTVGGWIAMNAGTREREMVDVVSSVELWSEGLTRAERVPVKALTWRYRELELPAGRVVIGATFDTRPDAPEAVRARMDAHLAARRATQPVNERSFGSVFKNPSGDHAGRLIEAAGLKGAREGDAQISERHANFIVNRGRARARDVLELIARAQRTVASRFGVELETEVRIVGEPA